MKAMIVFAGGLLALAACATSNNVDDSEPGSGDAQASPSDAGLDADAPDFDADADRPLLCSDAGLCETRLPTSDLGTSLSLRGVWVASSNDVWSVSAEGFVLHYDGAAWTKAYRANHALHAVWATATDVWVGGDGGLLLHRTAEGTWTRVEAGHLRPIRAIYGTSNDDVWFTGPGGSVGHFDGRTLTSQAIDVPELEITTVFGRAGAGTFAAGHVKGEIPPDSWFAVHTPYLFEISPSKITAFNATLQSQVGFVPMSGTVTEAPDIDQRVFLVGYRAGSLSLLHCSVGPSNAVELRTFPIEGSPAVGLGGAEEVSLATFPLWANRSDDIQVPFMPAGGVYHWNGVDSTRRSLGMGYRFVPHDIFGIHGDATHRWIVGDGFALKGPKE